MKKRAPEKLPKILMPVEEEIRNLLTMLEFYLNERNLSKPIEILADSVRDLRIIIQRLLLEHFLVLDKSQAEGFIHALAKALARRIKRIPTVSKEDAKYVDYCIGEIVTPFEWAREIKREYHADESAQKILALDIPVLRPFDYGLKSKIRLVKKP